MRKNYIMWVALMGMMIPLSQPACSMEEEERGGPPKQTICDKRETPEDPVGDNVSKLERIVTVLNQEIMALNDEVMILGEKIAALRTQPQEEMIAIGRNRFQDQDDEITRMRDQVRFKLKVLKGLHQEVKLKHGQLEKEINKH